MLVHAHPDVPLAIHSDTSDVAVGAILKQQVKSAGKPLGFFSKQLRKPKTKYSALDRELFAMYLAVQHFRFFVEGRPFTAFTDHKPPVWPRSLSPGPAAR